jgi:hypothetical protein
MGRKQKHNNQRIERYMAFTDRLYHYNWSIENHGIKSTRQNGRLSLTLKISWKVLESGVMPLALLEKKMITG